jgi:hypothetical protein
MFLDQLKSLAMGFNPLNGEKLPSGSLTHDVDTKQLLFTIVSELESHSVELNISSRKQLTPHQEKELREKNLKEARPPRSHFPWSVAEIKKIRNLYFQGKDIVDIAKDSERSELAVGIQLEKLGLISIVELEDLRQLK